MPRVQGHRERHPFDFYDCFDPTTIDRAGGCNIRLFNRDNVGFQNLSNLQIPGMLVCDQTAVIANVYARTNIPTMPTELHYALDQVSNMAVVTLVVGEMPQRQFNLAELLKRRPYDKTAYDTVDDTIRQQELDGTAAELCAAFYGHTDVKASWEGNDNASRERWRAVANTARFQIMGPNRPVIVPVRQNCGVNVDLDPRSLAKLVELIPKNIAPRPLIWIHLDGIAVRDQC